MAIVELKGQVRARRGKGAAREARRNGDVPGVVYGKGEDSVPVSINLKELATVIQKSGANVIIDLKLADQADSDKKALIRELQRDPISGQIIHLDLQHISMTEEITVEVPVHVRGVATGVKDFGGILEFVMRQVPVACLPMDIPESISIDITALGIHDSVTVGDVTLDKARIDLESDHVIVTVVPPTVEKVAEPTEEEEAAAAAEGAPEVIGEKKEGDEEASAEDKKS